ncbi:MAG: protein kinase [Bacteroidaceae bacterium]|nr:protein kinase [Bacteroidaceae bacterium]
MQSLESGSLLQGGKYRIERVLGQGGFGITYSAVQVALNRRVAIKEFFMKEYCERDANTSHVTVGTSGGAQEVKRFKEKFLKEASLIAQFDNPHIVRIHDIFEENGTAYYVMEFLEDRWNEFAKDRTSLEQSLNIIRQVGEGLSYIHAQNVLHLDVKPGNIMFRKDCSVLIDFGISKRYDSEGGQTSTTPVGISKGFAPLEQYNQGVQKFQPATDVYSLGATLYKLLTGETPPEASDVMNYGLPTDVLQARHVPERIISAIQKSMEPRVGQRYQSVEEFLEAIDSFIYTVAWTKNTVQENLRRNKDEETFVYELNPGADNNESKSEDNKKKGEKFLEDNKMKEGVFVLPSGVQYKIITQGSGQKPSKESIVTVNFESKLIDGTVLQSSFTLNEPVTFRCNDVIEGWKEALTHMPVGSTWEVYIPQELAYGDRVYKNIKPFSMLIIKTELIGVN